MQGMNKCIVFHIVIDSRKKPRGCRGDSAFLFGDISYFIRN